MPCVHPRESPHEHREIEQHLRHVSALSDLEDFAVAVESDETAHSMVSELLDLEALLGNSISSNPEEVHAMVTKLLSRTEMLNDPRALKAIREEADVFFLARCCLGQVPGGTPFSQRSELATACTNRMRINEPYKTN